jgi:Tetratricopeptide repeat
MKCLQIRWQGIALVVLMSLHGLDVRAELPAEQSALLVEQLAAEKYTEVLKLADKMLAKNTNDPETQLRRGVALMKLGRDKEAQEQFEQLTRLYPKLAAPYLNLAALFGKLGQLDAARGMLVKAIELEPAMERTQIGLGNVYLGLAWEAFQRAAQLNSSNTAGIDSRSKAIELLIKTPISAQTSPTSVVVEAKMEVKPPLPSQQNLEKVKPQPLPQPKPSNGIVKPPPAVVSPSVPVLVVEEATAVPTLQPGRAQLPLTTGAEVLLSPTQKDAVALAQLISEPPQPDDGIHEQTVVPVEATEQDKLFALLDKWLSAKAAHSVMEFLACYSENYRPAENIPREVWAQRVIQNMVFNPPLPEELAVLDIKIDDTQAQAFIEKRASTTPITRKPNLILKIKSESDGWKIMAEEVIR